MREWKIVNCKVLFNTSYMHNTYSLHLQFPSPSSLSAIRASSHPGSDATELVLEFCHRFCSYRLSSWLIRKSTCIGGEVLGREPFARKIWAVCRIGKLSELETGVKDSNDPNAALAVRTYRGP